jgi:hypothetical protein
MHNNSQSSTTKVPSSTNELVLIELLRIVGHGMEIGSFPGLLTLRHFNLEELIGWSI